jgi:CRISPR-associated protein Cas2
MVKRNLCIIAYDISNDRKRDKVSKLLGRYGTRANYSVFECALTDSQLEDLREEILLLIDEQTDRVLFYPICKNCFMKKFR